MKDLAGKVAFVTGAASGIGLGVATALAQAGVKVMLCDIEQAALANPADGPAYQPFDTGFHETLVGFSGNAELIEAYGRITGRIRTIRYRLNRHREQVKASQAEHAEIVHWLQAGNDEAALKCLASHVYTGYQAFLRGLDAEINGLRARQRTPKGS